MKTEKTTNFIQNAESLVPVHTHTHTHTGSFIREKDNKIDILKKDTLHA